VGNLDEIPATAPEKEVVRRFGALMKERADAYLDRLSDNELGAANEGLSSRMRKEMTHASTAALLSGHILYHLGAADAALREQGLKGVF
jgi:uncharacterized damage-inducible protein DinB